jgi:hypothetical protein
VGAVGAFGAGAGVGAVGAFGAGAGVVAGAETCVGFAGPDAGAAGAASRAGVLAGAAPPPPRQTSHFHASMVKCVSLSLTSLHCKHLR